MGYMAADGIEVLRCWSLGTRRLNGQLHEFWALRRRVLGWNKRPVVAEFKFQAETFLGMWINQKATGSV